MAINNLFKNILNKQTGLRDAVRPNIIMTYKFVFRYL